MSTNSPVSIVDVRKLREGRLQELLVVSLGGSEETFIWTYELAVKTIENTVHLLAEAPSCWGSSDGGGGAARLGALIW